MYARSMHVLAPPDTRGQAAGKAHLDEISDNVHLGCQQLVDGDCVSQNPRSWASLGRSLGPFEP